VRFASGETGKPFCLGKVTDTFERSDRRRRERPRSVGQARALLERSTRKQASEKTSGERVPCAGPVERLDLKAGYVTFERLARDVTALRTGRHRCDTRAELA
jgi:hypothetical protein